MVTLDVREMFKTVVAVPLARLGSGLTLSTDLMATRTAKKARGLARDAGLVAVGGWRAVKKKTTFTNQKLLTAERLILTIPDVVGSQSASGQ